MNKCEPNGSKYTAEVPQIELTNTPTRNCPSLYNETHICDAESKYCALLARLFTYVYGVAAVMKYIWRIAIVLSSAVLILPN